MKILKLRFLNLNSLLGEWEIDFTAARFTAEGIFAITGPTGAGKSTILDALCLALYGQTPRLGRITKSANEIMSRPAGECLAEVTFATSSGTFRCCWYQHRARIRPDGELQNPRHELVENRTNRVIANKLREVTGRVEAITGLDFERFTRSMLLAQGSFAVFLKARPDERAPILEQITGTGIYSKISIAVHERRSSERKKLELLEAALTGLKPLDGQEEEQITRVLREKSTLADRVERELKELDRALNWLNQLAELEREQASLIRERQQWSTLQEDLTTLRERLQQADRARTLAPAFRELELRRQESGKTRMRLAADRKRLPELERALAGAAKNHADAAERREHLQQALLSLSRTLVKVRAFDLNLEEQRKSLAASRKAVSERRRQLEELEKERLEKERLANRTNRALDELRQELSRTEADAHLIENLAAIGSRCAALRERDRNLRELADKIGRAVKLRDKAEKSLERCRVTAATAEKELEKRERSRLELEKELTAVLGEHSLNDWRRTGETLRERARQLAELVGARQEIRQREDEITALVRREKELESKTRVLADKLGRLKEKLAGRQRELTLAEENLLLRQRIESFADARRELVGGQPCPLCGALEHPFATGIDDIGASRVTEKLEKLRQELEQIRTEITRLEIHQAELGKERETDTARLQVLQEKLKESRKQVAELSRALDLDPADREKPGRLAGLLDDTRKQLDRTMETIGRGESLEKAREERRRQSESQREQVAQEEKRLLKAGFDLENAGREVARREREQQTLADRLQQGLSDLAEELAPFGLGRPRPDELEAIEKELENRRRLRLEGQAAEARLAREVASLSNRLEYLAESMTRARAELEREKARKQERQREIDGLENERRRLFGNRDPDREEEAARKELEEATRKLDRARSDLEQKRAACESVRELIGELARDNADQHRELAEREQAFRAARETAGFTEEAGFRRALLSEKEYNHLARSAADLERRRTELETREKDLRQRYQTLRARKLSDRPRPELAAECAERNRQLTELRQEIGGLKQQLTENEELKKRLAEQDAAVRKQSLECERWNLLHELIGSADGKKFRNFAQGLTFRIMIGQANRQLREITDRYLLTQSAAHPLELDVIDSWQGGEIRSTRNLSGGESFIVSLALALGLSRMAGHRIRIDSLFLDEGFGTLDGEALDAALEALAGLQQDGKLIGVISHVAALQERIATRIEVIPVAGGRSRISGPGCRRVTGREAPPTGT